MKALLSIGLAALSACGGKTDEPTLRGNDAGIGSTSDAAASNDVGPISDDASAEGSSQSPPLGDDAAAYSSAPQPRVNVAGVALWLDGEMGIAADGAGSVTTWGDRSGLAHVFLGKPSDGSPRLGQINGRGAVSFNGQNQVIIEQYPTPAQQAALNFDDDGFTLVSCLRDLMNKSKRLEDRILAEAAGAAWLGERFSAGKRGGGSLPPRPIECPVRDA